jgi:predicted ATPase/class 3 adenylate cyclase
LINTVPPSGVVAFLFTDVEGSTRLWETNPTETSRAIAIHDGMLRETITSHHGHVFSTGGDAFCAAFSSVSDALEAGIAAQLRLVGLEVGGEPLRVRMAVHAGEAYERDGDYFGPVLNRCARLMAAGHGGQVLLSAAAVDLARELLGPEDFIDLGEHRLKDLSQPERIFQLRAPELPAEFPPLRTLERYRHNLPIQLTSLVGRDQEAEEVAKLVRGSRLVTLTGPGGSGKTRLALEVGARLLDEFEDGVWMVDLAPVSDPGLVTYEIANTLAVGGPSERPILTSITDHIQHRQMLMVLDNCEHVIAEAARVVSHLVRTSERLTILATSREPLAVAGEARYPVPPLMAPALKMSERSQIALSPAVRLFAERAEIVRPEFRVTDANSRAVAALCAKLDGLPLALELAAARLRVLTPEELLARLDSQLRILGGSRRDVAARQATLHATLDWSHDLLQPPEQIALRRLSAFAGGFDLDAIEEICGFEPLDQASMLDLISQLVDKSLVTVSQNPNGTRYRLLETIRLYARHKLSEAGETNETERRHALHYLALAETSFSEIPGKDEVGWLQRLEEETYNLRQALTWCLDTGETQHGLLAAGSLYRFWYRNYHAHEGQQWLQQLLDADGSPTLPRARALLGAGTLTSDLLRSSALLDEAIQIYQESQNGDGELWAALNNRAYNAELQGDWSAAIKTYEANLRLSREAGEQANIARATTNLVSLVAQVEGDIGRAVALADEALTAARLSGSAKMLGSAWFWSGEARQWQGDLEGARHALHQSILIDEQTGDQVSDGLAAMAQLDLAAGDIDGAAANVLLLLRQVEHLRPVDDSLDVAQNIAWFLRVIAQVKIARGHYLEAVQNIAAALSASERQGGGPLPPLDQKDVDQALAEARADLVPGTFDQAWAKGWAWTLDEAIAEAIHAFDPHLESQT